MFDFSVFDTVTPSNEGQWLHITHPKTGEPVYIDQQNKVPKKPLRIHLMGIKSDKAATLAQKTDRANREKGKKNKTREQLILEDAEYLAGLSLGWENMPDDEGKEMPFTFENAVKAYRKFNEIREQILIFVLDKENFIKTSATD